MALLARFAAFAMVCLPVAAAAENYLGILKPPRSESPAPGGVFSLASEPLVGFSGYRAADSGHRMKLGYKYSRYFSVEGQFVDFGRAPGVAVDRGDELDTLGICELARVVLAEMADPDHGGSDGAGHRQS